LASLFQKEEAQKNQSTNPRRHLSLGIKRIHNQAAAGVISGISQKKDRLRFGFDNQPTTLFSLSHSPKERRKEKDSSSSPSLLKKGFRKKERNRQQRLWGFN
jgi:hypothetical protein